MSVGKNNYIKGILCIISAAFFFSLMSVMVRLAGDLPTMEKAFFRNAFSVIFAAVVLARTPEGFTVKKGSWPGLILRSLFGTLGIVCNFWAIDHMNIADANVLNKMSPFFAIILSAFILKERATMTEWITVVVAFVGAALVVKPTAGVASLPGLVGLLGGFGAGAAYTMVRMLGKRGERGPVIVLAFSVFSCLMCLPFVIMDFEPMTGLQFLALIGAGIAGMGGQFSVTAAYTHAPAKDISLFDYTQVIFASMWGLFLFQETPDLLSVVGYVIIISMAVLKWHSGRKKAA